MCGISNRLQELCNVYVEKTLRPAACLITRRHLYVSDDEEDEEDVEDASDHYYDYDEKLHPDLIFNICGLDQARKCAHYPQVRVHFQALHLMLSTLEALHLFCLFHIRTHPPPPPPTPTPPPLLKLKTLLTLLTRTSTRKSFQHNPMFQVLKDTLSFGNTAKNMYTGFLSNDAHLSRRTRYFASTHDDRVMSTFYRGMRRLKSQSTSLNVCLLLFLLRSPHCEIAWFALSNKILICLVQFSTTLRWKQSFTIV